MIDQTLVLTEMRCRDLIEWSANNDWFDPGFVEEMLDRIEREMPLSGKQKESIMMLHQRFIKE